MYSTFNVLRICNCMFLQVSSECLFVPRSCINLFLLSFCSDVNFLPHIFDGLPLVGLGLPLRAFDILIRVYLDTGGFGGNL